MGPSRGRDVRFENVTGFTRPGSIPHSPGSPRQPARRGVRSQKYLASSSSRSCVAEYTRMVRPNPRRARSGSEVGFVDRDIPDSHVREVNPALRELLAEPTP